MIVLLAFACVDTEMLPLSVCTPIEEADILLNTDFKAEGLTNEKQRTAYVNSKTVELKEAIKTHKHSLEIVNDLLKLRLQEARL